MDSSKGGEGQTVNTNSLSLQCCVIGHRRMFVIFAPSHLFTTDQGRERTLRAILQAKLVPSLQPLLAPMLLPSFPVRLQQ